MSTPVPVDLPAGFELTAQGCTTYTLTFHGVAIGFISRVEGVYLVRRGTRPGDAIFIGRFLGLRPAVHSLTDARSGASERRTA